jgi:hypothetical protein
LMVKHRDTATRGKPGTEQKPAQHCDFASYPARI